MNIFFFFFRLVCRTKPYIVADGDVVIMVKGIDHPAHGPEKFTFVVGTLFIELVSSENT